MRHTLVLPLSLASGSAFAATIVGSSADTSILTAWGSENNALVLNAYYPEVIQQSLPPGTQSPFTIFPSNVGLIGGEPYTAGMEPGTYPYQEPVLTSAAWAPGVSAWLGGNPVNAVEAPTAPVLTIVPPPQWPTIQAAFDNVPSAESAGFGLHQPFPPSPPNVASPPLQGSS
jgi:hypothetical protein